MSAIQRYNCTIPKILMHTSTSPLFCCSCGSQQRSESVPSLPNFTCLACFHASADPIVQPQAVNWLVP